ncbi:MAG: hypothetical protein Q4A01_09455 [Coriobacteriales bacterium]|nr:hypothetical protein [Coriobacteriales bacterium]
MSSEAKRVKILTLIELALGLALIVYGIVLIVGGMTSGAAYALCGEGAITMVFGVRGALIANVPARMGKLVTLGIVILLLQLACVAGVVMLTGPDKVAEQPVNTGISVVPALITLIAIFLARGITKKAER